MVRPYGTNIRFDLEGNPILDEQPKEQKNSPDLDPLSLDPLPLNDTRMPADIKEAARVETIRICELVIAPDPDPDPLPLDPDPDPLPLHDGTVVEPISTAMLTLATNRGLRSTKLTYGIRPEAAVMAANIDFTLGEDDSHVFSHDDEMIARSTTCDNESSICSEENGPFRRVFQNTTTDNGQDRCNLSLTMTHPGSAAGGNSSRSGGGTKPAGPTTPTQAKIECTRMMNMMFIAAKKAGYNQLKDTAKKRTSQLLRRIRPQYSPRPIRRPSSFSKVSQTLIVI